MFCNFTESFAIAGNILMVKLADMKEQKFWTPAPTEFRVLFGGELDVEPGRAFTNPYLLKRGHRVETTLINTSAAPAITVEGVTTTYRGVRLCEY